MNLELFTGQWLIEINNKHISQDKGLDSWFWRLMLTLGKAKCVSCICITVEIWSSLLCVWLKTHAHMVQICLNQSGVSQAVETSGSLSSNSSTPSAVLFDSLLHTLFHVPPPLQTSGGHRPSVRTLRTASGTIPRQAALSLAASLSSLSGFLTSL